MALQKKESVRERVNLFENLFKQKNTTPVVIRRTNTIKLFQKRNSNSIDNKNVPQNYVDELKTFLLNEREKKCDKEEYLNHILDLKNTEKLYVEDLRKSITLYDKFISIKHKSWEKIDELLKTLIYIFNGNANFYSDLAMSNNNVENILNIFIQHECMFENYTKYLVLQQKITDAEKEYSKIIKKLQQQVDMNWNLNSYLLIPWQRIIKYLLTLQIIEKYLKQQNQPTENVIKALAIVKEATTKANDNVALELVVNCPFSMETFGELTMRDTFIWKQKKLDCMVFLFGTVIVLTKIKNGHTHKKQFKYLETLAIKHIRTVHSKNKLIEFKVIKYNEKSKYLLEADSEQVAQRWLKAVEMKKHYKSNND